MRPENAIEVRDVRKNFKIYLDKGHMLRERVIHWNRNRYERREVLKGISFDVKKGESVGLIGRNGCGKSTTLKLLTRILRPNGGTIEIQGRVCSLIELGAGFHPDMSGRENIYINASIFGIKAKEVDRRIADIIRFSELEEFIDNPVRTYSSGMYMRLAFSVAINVDADVLLIDEILAVGDNSFQTKCFNKLKSLKEQGTTIVIVSHALGQIEKLCDRAIWIDEGVIRQEGSARKICKEYLEKMEASRLERAELEYRMQLEDEKRKKEEEERRKEERKQEEERQRQEKKREEEQQRKHEEEKRRNASCRKIATQCGPDARRNGSGEVQFTEVKLLDAEGRESLCFNTGDKMTVTMKYQSKAVGEPLNFVICLTRDDWVFCYGNAFKSMTKQFCMSKKSGEVEYTIERLGLLKGKYFMDVRLQKPNSEECYDIIYSLFEFEVKSPGLHEAGMLHMDCRWEEK